MGEGAPDPPSTPPAVPQKGGERPGMLRLDLQRLYSEKEVATLLGMTERMLAQRRRAGKIGCMRDGKLIAYSAQHIETYLRRHELRAGSRPKDKTPEELLEELRKKLSSSKWAK